MPEDAAIEAQLEMQPAPEPAAEPIAWETVLRQEHDAINRRRDRTGRSPIAATQTIVKKEYGGSGQFDTVGLALSGGGVRSAAYCLGATQALAEHEMFDCIDYLSTVSGGGYTGAAISSAMSLNGGTYPFKGEEGDLKDPDTLGHIRDYSNYLIPHGRTSLLQDLAVVIRGLVSNFLMVAPVIFLAAALTIYLNPTLDSLLHPALHLGVFDGNFAISLSLFLMEFVLFAAWAAYRSLASPAVGEFTGPIVTVGTLGLIILAFSAFCEIQPVIVSWMFGTAGSTGSHNFPLHDWVTWIVTILTPAVGIISLFAKKIGELLSTLKGSTKRTDILQRMLSFAAIWIVALALPVLLWMIYLLLVFWGIPFGITPSWVWDLAFKMGFRYRETYSLLEPAPVVLMYVIAAIACLVFWPLLKPNANSLHRLYRDRLDDAFLKTMGGSTKIATRSMKLSELNPDFAPYHLINAALNIQGASEANVRGRNAEFFEFAAKHSGSLSSCYAETKAFEKTDPALTLSAAMAISGAAVSSNMGSQSVAHMAPTLALLNLRLGYWLKNPLSKTWSPNLFYLVKEILSRLRPNDKWLYLTDGGHIDNTGIYALLRRRCSHIIAIDAEADPQMNFGSFVALQRYARIDLGARITMRWDKIAAMTLGAYAEGAVASAGPHCAIGEICYSNGGKGRLIYVKSSLTGDENVYVRDYARRYPDFPHETTGDQFFSEEQFEVYRALGFHIVNGLYKKEGRDKAEISDVGVEVKGTKARPAGDNVLFPPNC